MSLFPHRLIVSAAAVALTGAAAPMAWAHFDFTPRVEGNQVVTGGHDDVEGTDVDILRVNGYDFGETPGDPYNIGDPGFNTQGASTFTGASTLRLAGLPIEGAYLRYWDGTGAPAFDQAPANVSLMLSGSPTRYATFTGDGVTYTPSSPSSLLVGTFSGSGAMHVHLGTSIFADGDQIEGTVPEGAYLLAFELSNPGTGVTTSDPLYIVYNNGLDEEVHDAAMDHVQSTLVPEPATFGALGAGAAGLLMRRRRRQM